MQIGTMTLTQAEMLLGGLLLLALIALAWLLARSFGSERRLQGELSEVLAEQLEQRLGAHAERAAPLGVDIDFGRSGHDVLVCGRAQERAPCCWLAFENALRGLEFQRGYHTSLFVSCAALAGMATRPKGMPNRVPAGECRLLNRGYCHEPF